MRIYIQAQAQDNRSEDHFLIDGVVLSGDDPRVAEAVGIVSQVREHGRAVRSGGTAITRFRDRIALEITTQETDVGGRPAPLMVLLPLDDLASSGIPSLVDKLQAHAALIQRSVDREALVGDLEGWRLSPKARGSLLTRLLRRLQHWLRTHFERSVPT